MSESTRSRVIAIVRLAIMLASLILSGFGLVLDTDSLFTIAMCAIALVSAVVSWWKNNNITEAAQEAEKMLQAAKEAAGDSSSSSGSVVDE